MDYGRFGGTGSNSFDLKIVVEAFFYTNADGTKSYVKGRTMVWTVDIDKFSIGALTHHLAVQLNIGNNQLVSVWYYDKVLGQEVQLLYEQQPSLMFEMYAAELNVPLTVVVMDVTGSSASNW